MGGSVRLNVRRKDSPSSLIYKDLGSPMPGPRGRDQYIFLIISQSSIPIVFVHANQLSQVLGHFGFLRVGASGMSTTQGDLRSIREEHQSDRENVMEKKMNLGEISWKLNSPELRRIAGPVVRA